MTHRISVLPGNRVLQARQGENLLEVLRAAAVAADAPCGGRGSCGKCHVLIDGEAALACRTIVDRDMTVTLPGGETQRILTAGTVAVSSGAPEGYALAFDIGTTTVVGYLMKDGREAACAGAGNPQTAFGADVISRIRHGVQGHLAPMTEAIRTCLEQLTWQLCAAAGTAPDRIGVVSVVGNPAMGQILLGLPLDNLAKVPFAPVPGAAKAAAAGDVVPLWKNARLVTAPDIAGFVGADTVAGVMAAEMDTAEEMNLLVDIGTNGEMVLGNCHTMAACSAAAGPALEGAGIRFGMRGRSGAIDHVYLENGKLRCTVIGGGEAEGICGSGLIDAAAAALEAGWLNERGRILTADGLIHLTQKIYLDQEDIRQVQLAKGAIAAGILLMADHLAVPLEQIHRVYLAGAFGSYMDPGSACRIGLLPRPLAGKIMPIGNAAGGGARILACCPDAPARAQRIVDTTDALELAALPGFARCFARNMRF